MKAIEMPKTAQELVEQYLPDFKERYRTYYEVDLDDDLSLDYQLEYPDWIYKHFPEALTAFTEELCRQQREICALMLEERADKVGFPIEKNEISYIYNNILSAHSPLEK